MPETMALSMITFLVTASLVLLLPWSARLGRARPTKERLGRVTHGSLPVPQTAVGSPSIMRRRRRFIDKVRSGGVLAGVVATLSWLERLLAAAGASLTLSQLGAVILGLGLVVALVLVVASSFPLIPALLLGQAAALGVVVGGLLKRRGDQLRQFQAVFPEALDLIVRSVRAGLPVTEAIKLIGHDVAEPVGSAFREVAANLAIGLSLDDALTALRRKIPAPEVKFFAISLTIQQETGGNLAEILSNLANIMRKRVQVEKKIKAMSSEARASALIIGSLPFVVGVVIYLFNREYVEILFTDPTGRLFLGAAGGSMLFGALVMRKLIRLEV